MPFPFGRLLHALIELLKPRTQILTRTKGNAKFPLYNSNLQHGQPDTASRFSKIGVDCGVVAHLETSIIVANGDTHQLASQAIDLRTIFLPSISYLGCRHRFL